MRWATWCLIKALSWCSVEALRVPSSSGQVQHLVMVPLDTHVCGQQYASQRRGGGHAHMRCKADPHMWWVYKMQDMSHSTTASPSIFIGMRQGISYSVWRTQMTAWAFRSRYLILFEVLFYLFDVLLRLYQTPFICLRWNYVCLRCTLVCLRCSYYFEGSGFTIV